jgi:hypothetical protein
LSWLWPLNADGAPPIGALCSRTQSSLARMRSRARALTRSAALRLPVGWENAQAYLVLPIALIISQARA